MKIIPLTQNMTTIIDDEDYEKVKWTGKWYARSSHKKWYAEKTLTERQIRKVKERYPNFHIPSSGCIFMHRFLLECTAGDKYVDHVNHDGLDNRKSNLRVVTMAENCMNRRVTVRSKTGYKCVEPVSSGRYKAYIGQTINGKLKRINLGTYDTSEEAALAYNKKAIELFGEYAQLNEV